MIPAFSLEACRDILLILKHNLKNKNMKALKIRSFKLIKEYPGSSPLGTILNLEMLEGESVRYPEFYEEQVKLLVPIGSKLQISNGIFLTLVSQTNQGVSILVDNSKFLISRSISFVNERITNGKWVVCKQPLFTTSDGVDIFKGDKYVQIDPDWKIFEVYNAAGLQGTTNKFFSTQERAQKYIDLYKPQYSLADIQNSTFSISISINQKLVTINLDTLENLKK